jgi:aminodeoxyfutalosine deaminase
MRADKLSLVGKFIELVPKVELHLHLVGSASVDAVVRLARRKADSAVPRDALELRRYYRFTDFAHFIRVYADVTNLLRDADDFEVLVVELGRDLARQRVRYAEVTVTPYMHTIRGVPGTEIVDGIERGRHKVERELGVQLRWCFDIPGEYGIEAGMETARFALEHHPAGLVSFGLGGPELNVGRKQFRPAFLLAREAGLHSVPHAGETTGPEAIWSAINDLGAERIGHGIRCLEDPRLTAYLRERQLPLEVCPTSNVRTGQVASLNAHPMKRMIDTGLMVTVNSDDPGMFGSNLSNEYRELARMFDFDVYEIAELARNSVRASFLNDHAKSQLLIEIEETVGGLALA